MLSDVAVKLEYYPVVKKKKESPWSECPHNEGCKCNKRYSKCQTCGWNPKVAERRMTKMLEKYGLTEVPHGD